MGKKQAPQENTYNFTLPREIPGVMTNAFAHALETALMSYPGYVLEDDVSIEQIGRIPCEKYKNVRPGQVYTNNPALFETVFLKTFISAYRLTVYMCDKMGIKEAILSIPDEQRQLEIFKFASEQVAMQDLSRIDWQSKGPQWVAVKGAS